MCSDDMLKQMKRVPTITHADFVALTAAASAITESATRHASAVTETDVSITTADGVADAILVQPEEAGRYPAVIIWVDIMGLRQVYREMGRRLASQGYVVLVPNPFYRSAAAAKIIGADHDFMTPDGRARLMGYRQAISDAGIDEDARAYLSFLDAQPQVDIKKRIGVQGYCMGGPFCIRTAAASARVGAVGIFHANGLVTSDPSSPHLLIAGTDAQYLIGVARNDDEKDPEARIVLRRTFDDTGKIATIGVYQADHGWCVPDVPFYDQPHAEKAWAELTALYARALV